MNVYIGGAKDYSAMRGPCDAGFHVPTADEREALYNVGQTLGIWSSSNGTNIEKYLKMPLAGRRTAGYGEVSNQGFAGYYRSCISYYNSGVDEYRGYDMAFGDSFVYYKDTTYGAKANGMPIRPFKDTPVTPDSSWTALYSDKIYHNSTLGLISLSSDGATWYTMSDKNLGATTVYNYGNTLSESNCGKYYQRGNNYGFAWTGSITTSSTRINASTYGPGNYYQSSTFITGYSLRDLSNNNNLRGGETGIVSPVELKNAYIGEYIPPYLCLTSEQANSTVRLSKVGSPTFVTLQTSTDGGVWSDYTFGTDISLTNIGDKVYWRNKSETPTNFSTGNSDLYIFTLYGKVAASGDVNYLLCKNSTTTLTNDYCFSKLFSNQGALTQAPKLPATTLTNYCYNYMFYGTSITNIPQLPATTLKDYCYNYMFYNTSSVKLSTTQTGAYQTPYRIPTTGTGSEGINSLFYMFRNTGGTFTGTPSINTTYYTSNTVV